MYPKPHRRFRWTRSKPANGVASNGSRTVRDPKAREADARATTAEYEVEDAHTTATRHRALETLERVMLIALTVVALVIHAWPLSFAMLLAPLGSLAYRHSRGRTGRGQADAEDGEPPP